MRHIGRMVKEVLDNHPKSHTVNWLAKELNCCRENVYDIFRRPNIDMELLRRLSVILKHDFFADISTDLRDEIDDGMCNNVPQAVK